MELETEKQQSSLNPYNRASQRRYWVMGNASHNPLQPSKVIFIFSQLDFSSLHMKYEWESSYFNPSRGALLLPKGAWASSCPPPPPPPDKNLLSSAVWLGMINIPAVALGMFSGGVIMKRHKLGIMGAAKFAFGTSLLGYFLSLFFLAMGCENSKVAGITVSYTGYVISGYIFHMSQWSRWWNALG